LPVSLPDSLAIGLLSFNWVLGDNVGKVTVGSITSYPLGLVNALYGKGFAGGIRVLIKWLLIKGFWIIQNVKQGGRCGKDISSH
jgi:hypothetical protein